MRLRMEQPLYPSLQQGVTGGYSDLPAHPAPPFWFWTHPSCKGNRALVWQCAGGCVEVEAEVSLRDKIWLFPKHWLYARKWDQGWQW